MKKNLKVQALAFLSLGVSFFAISLTRAAGTRTAFVALGVVFMAVGVVRLLGGRGGNR